MVAVAIVGVTLGGGREITAVFFQWEKYSRQARKWAWYEQQERGFIRDVPYFLKGLKDTPRDREFREYLVARDQTAHRLVTYNNAMRRKYERAAHFPWLPVEPDPPPPRP
jgi:hypothetical protein